MTKTVKVALVGALTVPIFVPALIISMLLFGSLQCNSSTLTCGIGAALLGYLLSTAAAAAILRKLQLIHWLAIPLVVAVVLGLSYWAESILAPHLAVPILVWPLILAVLTAALYAAFYKILK